MEKEKNIIIIMNWNLMENIKMEKNGMGKENNLIVTMNYYLKENI